MQRTQKLCLSNAIRGRGIGRDADILSRAMCMGCILHLPSMYVEALLRYFVVI